MSAEKIQPLFRSRDYTAKRLNVHPNTVDNWIRVGALPSVKVRGRRLVPDAAITDLEARAMSAAAR